MYPRGRREERCYETKRSDEVGPSNKISFLINGEIFFILFPSFMRYKAKLQYSYLSIEEVSAEQEKSYDSRTKTGVIIFSKKK